MLTIISFEGQASKTLLTVRSLPINASAAERATFLNAHDSMRGGWGGTLDQLAAHLAQRPMVAHLETTMTTAAAAGSGKSKAMFWTGWVLSVLPALLLLFSAAMKFIKPAGMAESLKDIGWEERQLTGLGIVEAACAVLFLVPRTAVLGAILITGYMGGAIATHVRVGDPFVTQALLGVIVWLGIYLREPRLRALIPVRCS